MVDLTVRLGKPTNLDELLQTLDLASTSPRFPGILSVEHESLVSSDFIGHPSSSIVDATACMGLNDKVWAVNDLWYSGKKLMWLL
jgi:glyceraldehyde 3-phosphate dehydrogenase